MLRGGKGWARLLVCHNNPIFGSFFSTAHHFGEALKDEIGNPSAATLYTESIIDRKQLFLLLPLSDQTDYESPYINETEYHQIQPYVRSGFNYQSRDRNRFRTSYGNVITHRDRNQFDYVDERDRKSDADFYDNRHYDHSTMHRWVALISHWTVVVVKC